jgi:hypothetical protein
MINVDIGSANADSHHLHKNLSVRRLRSGNFLEFDLSRGSHHSLHHFEVPPFTPPSLSFDVTDSRCDSNNQNRAIHNLLPVD